MYSTFTGSSHHVLYHWSKFQFFNDNTKTPHPCNFTFRLHFLCPIFYQPTETSPQHNTYQVLYQFSYHVLIICLLIKCIGYTKPNAHARSVLFNVILYANIIVPYMVQTQSSKSWVSKTCFSWKVRQQQLNIWYRTHWFFTIKLVLQPPLQYQQLISFFLFSYFSPLSFTFPSAPKTIPSIATNTPFHYKWAIFQLFTLLYRNPYSSHKTFSFLPISAFSQLKLQKAQSEQKSIVRTDTVLAFSSYS